MKASVFPEKLLPEVHPLAPGEKAPVFLMATPYSNVAKKEQPERSALIKKWEGVCDALEQCGAHLDIVDHGQNSIATLGVFTRDSALILGNQAYLPDPDFANLRQPTAQNEQAVLETRMKSHGLEVHHIKGAAFEGGNVIADEQSRTIFWGYKGGAAMRKPIQIMMDQINDTQDQPWDVLPVHLLGQDIYHLDIGMSRRLKHGHVLLLKGMTTPETGDAVIERLGKSSVIRILQTEAKSGAANLNCVSSNVILSAKADRISNILRGLGYNPVSPDQLDLSDFLINRGGVHCMTNDLGFA